MAKHYVKPYVEVNGTPIAGVRNATTNAENQMIDGTDGDSAGSESFIGLRKDTIDLDLFQDYAALGTDAVLWPLFDAGTSFEVRIAQGGSVVSPTNPAEVATVIISKYPDGGDVGTAAMLKVSLDVQGKISRDTT